MANNNSSKKNLYNPFNWIKRMFMGASKELTVADERYDSPGKLAVKRFFRKPLATAAVILLIAMFLFVLIGPLFAPVDLTETGSELLHTNVAPTMSMMKISNDMKQGTVSISSRSTFSVGVDTKGKLTVWGYFHTLSKESKCNVFNIPDEVKNSKIVIAAAGKDHIVAISEDGHVYCWGEYDNGQYGLDGSTIAMCREEPDILMNGTIDASNVKELVCGNQVSAILMNDGTLYAWGNDAVAATNLSSVIKASKEEGGKLKQIVFTNSGFYGINEKGEFVTGKSTKYDNYDLGNGEIVETREYIGSRKLVDMCAAGDALCVLLDDGEIMLMGTTAELPTLAEGEKIVEISAGTRHFTCLTNMNRVYSWGQSYRGQCDVPEKLQVEGSVDRVIACGFQNYAFKDGKFVGSWGLKGYLMGTDEMGRDVFNRLMNGGKMTMTIGAVAVIVSTIIGVIIGCISGYFGGIVDMLLMRVTEIFGAIPFLPFALCLSAILQGSDLHEETRIFIIMIILGMLSWTGLARLVRGQILAEREKEFVTAAKAMGVKEGRIAFKHILPNIISVILVTVTLDFAGCMLTESSLSYLGFGVKLPRPTWGNMLDGSRNALVIQTYYWRWIFPALFLSIVVICINIIGDTLRDILDPKSEVDK